MVARIEITVRPGKLEYQKKRLRQVMRAAGKEVQAAARKLVQNDAGGGRMYYGPGGSAAPYRGGYVKGRHQASRPGDPPARITGKLANSFKVSVFRSGEGVAIRDVMFYGKFLEAGAKGGVGSGKAGVRGRRNVGGPFRRSTGHREAADSLAGARVLAPRPFLTAALASREATIGARIGASINEDLKFVRQKP